jgi:hypothetical protein
MIDLVILIILRIDMHIIGHLNALINKSSVSQHSLLQGIFIGILTFSIPFMWNAYQQILELKEKTRGEKIENILTQVYYQKKLKYFTRFVQIIASSLIFLALFLVPVIPPFLGFVILIICFVYFACLPQIYNEIDRLSFTRLSGFIDEKDAKSEEFQKVFYELWQKSDAEIEKEFSINILTLTDKFFSKLAFLTTQEESLALFKLLTAFTRNFEKRNLAIYLSKDITKKILELHFSVWKKGEILIKSDRTETWSYFNQSENVLSSIIENLLGKALDTRQSFLFFYPYIEFVTSKTTTVKYLEDLFGTFYRTLFNKINSSYAEYDVWQHYFPKEWKITKNNYEDKQNVFVRLTINEYMHWAIERMDNSEKYDIALDGVTRELFPETEPGDWAIILMIFFAQTEERIGFVLNRSWNFGAVGRIHMYSNSASEAALDQDLDQQRGAFTAAEDKATVELALLFFPNLFTEENLKTFIKRAEETEVTDDVKKGRKIRLINLLKKLLAGTKAST